MWHIDAEIISLLFLLVLTADIGKGEKTEGMRDKLFRALSITTVFAILLDIVSSYGMSLYQTTSWWLLQLSLVGYFIVTPLLSVLWLCYSLTVAYKPSKKLYTTMLALAVPFVLFVVVVLSNPSSGLFFTLSPANEYGRGVLFNSLFYMFYGYSLMSLVVAAIRFRKNERATSIILALFPIIAGIGVWLQQIFPSYLFTGAAFTLVLFITYIYLQNRKLTRDILTGLWNRSAFLAAVDRVSKTNERGYVIALSLENFKLVNQTFGQHIGDELLRRVGEYLVSVSPKRTCYRYSGDIFTLFLPKTDFDHCTAFTQEVLHRFAQPFSVGSVDYSLSAALGAVGYPYTPQEKNGSIIDALDFVIYETKRGHRGQVVFHDESLIKRFKRQHDVAQAVDYATKNDTFEVYIQPVYSLEQGRYGSGEALLRLNDPTLSFIPPSEFIPLAEKSGQIVEITYQIVEKVCGFLRENRDILHDQFSVSINFSVIQFMQSDMAHRVMEIIEKYDLPPRLIRIEVTESVIADTEDIRQIMQTLLAHGIHFALDDYGQGYSNMSYLINLPFYFVKIDKSIIDGIVGNSDMIRALIPMFQCLEKVIVAEGVETKDQVDILQAAHCNFIQGYYYAKPMPMADCLTFLAKAQETPTVAQ